MAALRPSFAVASSQPNVSSLYSNEGVDDHTSSSLSSENVTEFGFIVVIKRNGDDGPSFPVMEDTKIGRGKNSHIRIQLQTVRFSSDEPEPKSHDEVRTHCLEFETTVFLFFFVKGFLEERICKGQGKADVYKSTNDQFCSYPLI